MKELEKLMKRPKNEYDETYGKELYLESINDTGILPYKEIIETYPGLSNVYLSPVWKEVNIRKISEKSNIPRDHFPGETKYIGVDNDVAMMMDNNGGVVMRYLGEYMKLEELIIVRNYVFDNIIEEIGKLTNLKKLLFADNQAVNIRQYDEELGKICKNNGEKEAPIKLEIKAIENLTNLEELELVKSGIKEMPEELNRLQDLRGINLSHNEQMDLTKMEGYEKLQHVKLTDVGLKEIPKFVLESKETLKTLDISNNHLVDIEHAADLEQLESINLRGIKKINNLYDILDMPNIERIYVDTICITKINHEKIESGRVLIQEGKTWAEYKWLEEEHKLIHKW